MERNILQFNRRVNYLITQTDMVYHEIARRLGLSDSELMVLYVLTDAGGTCPLSAIYGKTGLSKQTISSALRKLEADRHISLHMADGKRKIVCLTSAGEAFAAKTAGWMLSAENEIYASWPKEDLDAYLRLTEKYLAELREKIKELGEKSV